jgi:hypothetical protein
MLGYVRLDNFMYGEVVRGQIMLAYVFIIQRRLVKSEFMVRMT